jgi:uncharacterized protein (DUF2236 family)
MTPEAEYALGMAQRRDVTRVPVFPPLVWKALARWPVSETIRIFTVGGLPENVRRRFDIPWSDFDQLRLDAAEEAVRKVWHRLPHRARYHPRAYAGRRHAWQQRAA